jgi:hypothetical protein
LKSNVKKQFNKNKIKIKNKNKNKIKKMKPIKLFNKKKAKILNFNNKPFNKKKLTQLNNDYFLKDTLYLFNKFELNFYFINKFSFFNKFFKTNRDKSTIILFYNYSNKTKFLFLNNFYNFFLKIYNFIFNKFFEISLFFSYFYYINNSFFIIKNIFNFYFTNFNKNYFFFNFLNRKLKRINFIKFNNNKHKHTHSDRKEYLYNLIFFVFSYKFFLNKSRILSFFIKFEFKHFKFFRYFLSKFYYNNIYNKKKIKLISSLVFKVLKSDWLTNNFARLVRSSLNFDSNSLISFNFLNKFNKFSKELNLLEIENSLTFYDFLSEHGYFFNNINNFFDENLSFDKINYSFFFVDDFYNLNSLTNYKKLTNYPLNYNWNKNPFSYKLNSYFNFNKFEILTYFFSNIFFFKYNIISNKKFDFFFNSKSFKKTLFNLIDSIFYSVENKFYFNNLIPNFNFNFIFKKKIIKIFSYTKFTSSAFSWQYNAIVRFLEFCSGKKVCLKFFNFIKNTLNFNEKSQCYLWSRKVKYFRKVLGPRLFLNESLQIIYLALKIKDPYFLSNWMVATMYKISFWKYKMFLRYLKYVLRYFFWVIFKDLKVKGIKFQLKGKISVAGNARTRTVFHNVGFTSHSTFNNKILYHLNFVRSFTGIMGFKLWIVF